MSVRTSDSVAVLLLCVAVLISGWLSGRASVPPAAPMPFPARVNLCQSPSLLFNVDGWAAIRVICPDSEIVLSRTERATEARR